MKVIELTEVTPARILGVAVDIMPGTRLRLGSPHDAGGVEVCEAWALRDGPAALAPFAIGADYLRAQGLVE